MGGILFLSFQTWLHRHVWFAFSWVKLWRYWPYLCLKFTVHPVCVLIVLLSSLVIVALYTRFVTEHLFGMGHSAFLLLWQLQCKSVFRWGDICCWWSLRIFWLCFVTILLMLFVVLYDNLIVFLLQILCSTWFWGKHSLMIFRKVAPTLVFTLSAYGGLNHVILLFLLLLLLLFTIFAFLSYLSLTLFGSTSDSHSRHHVIMPISQQCGHWWHGDHHVNYVWGT